MKLPERLARRKGRGFHSAIVTSFAVEFAAFEEVMLPQLGAGGSSNVLLIADARMTAMSLSDGSNLPMQLGRDYVLFSPPVGDGVFHPKIVLQLGRDAGRCFVTSANATGAGLGGNVEIAVEVECGSEPSAEREIVRAAWRYLERLVPSDAGAARDAMNWARERAQWLDGPAPDPLQTLEDGTAMALLARPDADGIASRFASLVGDAVVERLIIVSPYWDQDLAAVDALEERLAPGRTTFMLDVRQHEFPAAISMPDNREIIDVSDWRPNRFTHGKLIIAVTAEHDHVLSGSANCTVAALGNASFGGVNAEAVLYRRLTRGAATAALDLDDRLAGAPFPIGDLPNRETTPAIPLGDLHAARAGAFETEGGRLHWRRGTNRWRSGKVVLIDEEGRDLREIEVDAFLGDGDRASIWIGEAELAKAAFAKVRSGEGESLRTFVNHRSALRTRRREQVGGSVARALSMFDDGSDLHLWVHQAFDQLCRADVESEAAPEPKRIVPRARAEEDAGPKIRHMTYEEFMTAHVVKRGRAGRTDSTLAGTHCDSVRALLNRLAGDRPAGAEPPASKDDDGWMDMGDEDGELAEMTGGAVPLPTSPEVVGRGPPDAVAYERSVKAYVHSLTIGEGPIGPRDVLRLRLWLMLLLQEARCRTVPKGMLANSDETGWPRLVVRIVAAFFWGKSSAIRRLMLSDEYAEMPIDFLECWATVLWTLDAILASVAVGPKNRDFLKRIPQLRAHVVLALGLLPEDLAGEAMATRRDGLDERLGQRLGIAGDAVIGVAGKARHGKERRVGKAA